MFEGSDLKVQLATGHGFYTKTKYLLSITFIHSLEYIVDYYIVDKLTTPIVLGMHWL